MAAVSAIILGVGDSSFTGIWAAGVIEGTVNFPQLLGPDDRRWGRDGHQTQEPA